MQEEPAFAGAIIRCAVDEIRTTLRSRLSEALLCLWIIAAQIWYYIQFKDQFTALLRSSAAPLFHRIWH
jgi:formate/nitrite transporter FocA (FNT family)